MVMQFKIFWIPFDGRAGPFDYAQDKLRLPRRLPAIARRATAGEAPDRRRLVRKEHRSDNRLLVRWI